VRIGLALVFLLAASAGCLKGTGSDDASAMDGFPAEPSFDSTQPASVTGLEFVAQLKDSAGNPFPSGGGNFVFGDFVFGSGLNSGFFIADASDPENPVLAYNTTADTPTPFSRKADIIAHPDGRRTLVLATQTNGMHLWNVTDPYHPEFASIVDFEVNHNIAVVPGTELVFNNPSKGIGLTNALVDASDPYEPEILGEFGTHGCHGTTFRGLAGEEGARAYCAAIQHTEIWDLSGFDPSMQGFNITVLGVVEGTDSPVTGSPQFNPPLPPNPVMNTLPVRNLHHFAAGNADGTVLIIGDEHQGGGNPGACFASQETAAGTASTPLGALWFYDVSDEADPVLLSWISPPTKMLAPPTPPDDPTQPGSILPAAYGTVPNCTAHFGTVIPGEEKIVIAWYTAGVLLIDFTDPAQPTILAQYQVDDVNAWNARAWNGYVFTGDTGRGMDVLRLT
jgi:hypothetical protein